jgi:hypothetical protein
VTYTDEDLDAAVAGGALHAEAAAALRAHVSATRRLPAADEEHFRLVAGFNDIFVVLAGGLLLIALGGIGGAWHAWFGSLLVAIASWVLAEFFVLRRRMALPAIVFLLTFVGAVFSAFVGSMNTSVSTAIAGGMVACGASWVHWRRFRVPITVAAGTAAAVVAIAVVWLQLVPSHSTWIFFVCGLAVFAWALAWDMTDLARTTRRSDVAFWLHLLAAPLLVHPVFTALGTFGKGDDGAHGGPAAVILLLYVGLALVSLWIDRRALMVSALGYVLYAFTRVLQDSGLASLGFATTALVVGAALLLLSAFWQRSRALTLPWLPEAWRLRLPPLQDQAGSAAPLEAHDAS